MADLEKWDIGLAAYVAGRMPSDIAYRLYATV
jgi:transcriptional regulator of heat shock response